MRGAGPDKTFLKSYADWHSIQIGDWPSPPVAAAVSGSPGKGATTLAVANATSPSLSVGDYIVIDQINDGSEVVNVDDQSRAGNTRCLSQITRITGISGSGPYSLTIEPPLYHTYSSSQKPEIWELNQGNAITTNAGLEDLRIERISPISYDGFSNIKFLAAAYSWVKNVESKLTTFWHVDFDRSFRCEVRDSFFNDGYFQGTGGFSYGVVCDNRSTGHLIENNIFYHLRHSMVVKGGATGCVFAHNYSFDSFQNDHWLATDIFVHGAHATMNLFEGNYCTKIQGDYTHGSGSYNTFFRNFVTRVSNAETITGGRIAVCVDLLHNYYNFVGNVIGESNLTWTAEETGATRDTSGSYVWSWGFRWDGDSTRASTQPRDTVLRHGNYSAYSRQISWDPAIQDRNLPASLYSASKPAFFGNLPWPAIGPDLSPMVRSLPAKDRYSGTPPPATPPPATPPPATNPVISVTGGSQDFGTVQVGASADRNLTVQNIGTGTLVGAATTTQPFSIVSGGSYSLGSNQSQVVTVRYAPQAAGVNTGTVTFTGGGGASVALTGSALAGSGSPRGPLPGLSFESTAGVLQTPFVASAGYISQPVETLSPSTGGQATYDFQITAAGNYTISALVNAQNNGANSFYVNVDAQPTDPTMIWDIPVVSGFTNAVVSWRGTGTDGNNQFSPKVFSLSAGVHRLIIRGREANVQLGKITISPVATPPQPISFESTAGLASDPVRRKRRLYFSAGGNPEPQYWRTGDI